MSDFRRHKKDSYTCIDNQVFRDNTLSMKAKGLLTQIYSLPDEWNYSVAGLATLFSDGKDAVNTALQELINHGYIVRTQRLNELGQFDGYEYDIYETPQAKGAEKPITDDPSTENPSTENPTQLNTNNKTLNNKITKDIDIEDKPKKRFVPPTVEEVAAYCQERNNNIDPEAFVAYYSASNWYRGKTKIQNWKKCVITWERNNYGKQNKKSGNENEFLKIAEMLEAQENEQEGSSESFGDIEKLLSGG